MVVRYYRYIVQFLILILAVLAITIFQLPDSNLHVIACDVGQGDAILITYKNIQILTDGGPDTKVMDCLSKHVPFYDREIELIISTHPDADHSTGLITVLKRYKVDNIMINDLDSGTATIKALNNEVGSRGIHVIRPVTGLKLRVGLIYLDVLHPTQGFTSTQTNSYSIVDKLTFGNFKAIFTGDIGPDISDSLINNYLIEPVNYLKVPHHGSKNGLTQNLLEKLKPEIAVISVGKKNRYGHPSQEILEMLNKYKLQILRTDEMRDVEVISNGKSFWVKK
jgi:competence protein ComEC